ncbi:recombination-associated protein RdgC [Hydrogenophaga sp.]|uniref:recombination-associated protein RdgC n=1 Tax=Hydrogenophaga sp. TaxID=1904254 RepID=UPI0027261D29|nr:recombination-associated protein RdgC [Hydrogenophaga sp.]MDO8904851.1 recombination-associated protein RdgC [Hydrogenophaga sp.]
MFKNLTIYRMQPGWALTLDAMEAALDASRFVPCGATQDKAMGWVEPRGEAHGPLVESVAGQRILKLKIETKGVPGSVVREKAQEAADHIEASTGRKPGKKETKALREDALLALLPQAFARQMTVWVWIDLQNGWLVTDASSQGKLDEVVTALVRAFDGLAITLLQTQVTPQTAMTRWLSATSADPDEGAVPGGFAIERECELKSGDEEKSVVKFTRHNLATDEVRKHIVEGKLPTRLALSWEGRIGFVLTESLQLKKLVFLEGVFDDRSDDGESGFDTDVALSTGELQKLIPELIEALGGEMAFDAAATAGAVDTASAATPTTSLPEPVTADDEGPPF